MVAAGFTKALSGRLAKSSDRLPRVRRLPLAAGGSSIGGGPPGFSRRGTGIGGGGSVIGGGRDGSAGGAGGVPGGGVGCGPWASCFIIRPTHSAGCLS